MRSIAALVLVSLPLAAQRVEPVHADFETVWDRYLALADDAEGRAGFLSDLAAAGRSEVLESIVVSGEHDPIEALRLLVEADDPRWVRAAAWALERRDSHLSTAGSMHLAAGGAAVDAWLVAHAEALGPRGRRLSSERAASTVSVHRDPRHLAPFARATILVPLEPGWTHDRPATLRALDAWAFLASHEPHRIARVVELVGGDDPVLARRAALAFTYLPAAEVPSDALAAVVRDAAADAELRAAALAGASHGPHTIAWLLLIEVASSPEHPAWRIAIDRLADMDLGFAREPLPRIADGRGLAPEPRAFLDDALARIDARLAASADAPRLVELLERAAWADLVCASIEGPLGEWTLARIAGWLERPGVRERLAAIRDSYEPAEALDRPATFGDLGARVRGYAERILDPR